MAARPALPRRLVRLVLALAILPPPAGAGAQAPEYSIHAVRYATVPDFPVASLVRGAPSDERLDIAMVLWVLQGGGRTVLFDSGFHRPAWFERFHITDYLRPDEAVRLVGVEPGDVTDVVVSHAHWDHMGGIDLFPEATLWIQRQEFAHYTGPAWQEGGGGGGADPGDVVELVRRNTLGQVRLVEGDGVEVLPGLRVHTGARHTYASQYLVVEAEPPWVLASDNAYLYRNLEEMRPVATFTPADSSASLRALERILELAGDVDRVVPGHDPLQFRRFPGEGRVVRIR